MGRLAEEACHLSQDATTVRWVCAHSLDQLLQAKVSWRPDPMPQGYTGQVLGGRALRPSPQSPTPLLSFWLSTPIPSSPDLCHLGDRIRHTIMSCIWISPFLVAKIKTFSFKLMSLSQFITYILKLKSWALYIYFSLYFCYNNSTLGSRVPLLGNVGEKELE